MRHFEKPVEAPYWLVGVLKSIRSALGDIWEVPLRLKEYTTAQLPDPTRFAQGLVYDETEQDIAYSNGQEWRYLFASDEGAYVYESHLIELGDEATALTAGTAKKTIRWPYRFQLAHPEGGPGLRASLTTASSSGLVSVDINHDPGTGAASILSTKLSIDANETTSTTAATPAVLSNGTLEDDAEITFDIDAAGANAAGLKVWLVGYRIGTDDFFIMYEGDMNVTGNDLEMLEGDMTDGDDLLFQEAA